MEGQKVALPGAEATSEPEVRDQLVFSLVLETRMRRFLERECRANKKGHHRKLTKKDHEAINQELLFMRFNPDTWAAAAHRRFVEVQEEAQRQAAIAAEPIDRAIEEQEEKKEE